MYDKLFLPKYSIASHASILIKIEHWTNGSSEIESNEKDYEMVLRLHHLQKDNQILSLWIFNFLIIPKLIIIILTIDILRKYSFMSLSSVTQELFHEVCKLY